VQWIHLAQHRDRWRALVNVVMNLRVLVYGISTCSYQPQWPRGRGRES
jgi:hypothetical protein